MLHVTEDFLAAREKRMRAAEREMRPTVTSTRRSGDDLAEDEEQILLFQWAGYMIGAMPELALLFHIPNGGARTPGEAGRFRAMGVKAGVPDLFLPVPRQGCFGLFIELKRKYGGQLSNLQRDWLDDLSARGYRAVMCHGWEAARDVLIDYLRR